MIMELKDKTNPYTPQHNGVGEWMNGTIMERVRSMLGGDGLENTLWVKVVSIGYYVIKRYSISSLMED